jgi:hypothetical protein
MQFYSGPLMHFLSGVDSSASSGFDPAIDRSRKGEPPGNFT